MQTSTGFNHAEGQAAGVEGPKELPMQILDHATGYLMAFGAMMARLRQAREGGSRHVQVSLAQTARWLWTLGRLDHGRATADLPPDKILPFIEQSPSDFGALQSIRHAATMSRQRLHFGRVRLCLSVPMNRSGHHAADVN